MVTTRHDESQVTAAHDDPRIARSRAKMLAAATELLVERGPRHVTADAVCERSGVAKSTMYRHWASINELLVDVMRCNIPEVADIDLAAGFEPALRSWVRHVVATLSDPEWARILPALIELRRHTADMSAVFDTDFADKLQRMAQILQLGTAEGRVPAGLDPALVNSILVGPAVMAVLTEPGADVSPVAEFALERFLASYPAP
jgi:AcrR family transcriptional regulator